MYDLKCGRENQINIARKSIKNVFKIQRTMNTGNILNI